MNTQRMYDAAPVWLQNAAISVLGIRARMQRYGGGHRELLRELRTHERFSQVDLVNYQTQRLRGLIEHVRATVPHYRDQADLRSVDSSKIVVSDLPNLLPVIQKSQVRSDPSRFHAETSGPSRLVTLHTSGTTASPLPIRATLSAIRANYAFFARFLAWHGTHPLARSITLAGRLVVPASQIGPPFHRTNRGLNDALLSSYRIAESTKDEYRRVFEVVAPSYIDAYPSAICAVATLLRDAPPQPKHRPNVIVTSSETLLANQRAIIEQVIGSPVRDQYGSAELAVFACECEHGSLHINSDYGIVETLRNDGHPTSPGEIGRLVVTGFWNPAMPLIRYEIGDSAVLDDVPCPCGRAFPIIRELVGRTDDLVKTPSGRLIGRLDPAFKDMPGLIEAQIVQTAPDSITVNAVLDGCALATLETRIRENLAARLEPSMRIHISRVDCIPRTPAGKFQSVISMLPKSVRG